MAWERPWSANTPPAATITKSFTFSAATAGPIATHSGSFTISYDPAAPFYAPTVDAIGFRLGDEIFNLNNTGIVLHFADAAGPQFILGGLAAGPNGISGLTDDFWLIFKADTPAFINFAYGLGQGETFLSPTGSIAPGNAVPEPAAWAMMIAGFGLAGVAVRRRQSAVLRGAARVRAR